MTIKKTGVQSLAIEIDKSDGEGPSDRPTDRRTAGHQLLQMQGRN